MLINYYLNTN